MAVTYLQDTFDSSIDTNVWNIYSPNGTPTIDSGRLHLPVGACVNCFKTFPDNIKITCDFEFVGIPDNTDTFIGNSICGRVGGTPVWVQFFIQMASGSATQFNTQIKDLVGERTLQPTDLALLASKTPTSFKVNSFGLAIRKDTVTLSIGNIVIGGFKSGDFTRTMGSIYFFGAGTPCDTYLDNVTVTNK